MRPVSDLHGFKGQGEKVHRALRRLHGARKWGKPCPHLLMIGPSGMGKNKLTKALAKEAGVECHEVVGKATPKDLCKHLVECDSGDFFFCDEGHNLIRDSQELLYQVIDSSRVVDHLGNQQTTKPVEKDEKGKLIIPPITIVLATNQPGELLNALLQRMDLTIFLDDYSEHELTEIAKSVAAELGVVLNNHAMHEIARVSQGRPRRVKQHLRALLEIFAEKVKTDCELNTEDVRTYLRKQGYDAAGLNELEQKYLLALHKLNGASVYTLAQAIGADAKFVENEIEPVLVTKLFFVMIGRTGRTLTPLGQKWVQDRIKETDKEEDNNK